MLNKLPVRYRTEHLMTFYMKGKCSLSFPPISVSVKLAEKAANLLLE